VDNEDGCCLWALIVDAAGQFLLVDLAFPFVVCCVLWCAAYVCGRMCFVAGALLKTLVLEIPFLLSYFLVMLSCLKVLWLAMGCAPCRRWQKINGDVLRATALRATFSLFIYQQASAHSSITRYGAQMSRGSLRRAEGHRGKNHFDNIFFPFCSHNSLLQRCNHVLCLCSAYLRIILDTVLLCRRLTQHLCYAGQIDTMLRWAPVLLLSLETLGVSAPGPCNLCARLLMLPYPHPGH
jgi:hypothetical protein